MELDGFWSPNDRTNSGPRVDRGPTMGTLVGEVPMQVGRKHGIPILALYAAPELQRSPVIGLGANHKT